DSIAAAGIPDRLTLGPCVALHGRDWAQVNITVFNRFGDSITAVTPRLVADDSAIVSLSPTGIISGAFPWIVDARRAGHTQLVATAGSASARRDVTVGLAAQLFASARGGEKTDFPATISALTTTGASPSTGLRIVSVSRGALGTA